MSKHKLTVKEMERANRENTIRGIYNTNQAVREFRENPCKFGSHAMRHLKSTWFGFGLAWQKCERCGHIAKEPDWMI